MSRTSVSAIVLAGGRSSRFGRDKLVEDVGGQRLLDLSVAAVRLHADEIVVVIGPDADTSIGGDVRIVRDPVAFQGPLVGLLTGLRAVRGAVALVVGGDMPMLAPEVAALLLAPLAEPEPDGVVLEHDGRPRPLPLAIRPARAAPVADRLVAAGERRLRSLVEGLAVTVISEVEWRRVDPDGRSVRDIDRPSDLA